MPALLAKLAAVATAHPRRVLVVAILATLPALVVASGLGVSTSRTALVSEENPEWKRYMRFAREFGIPEDLVVVAKGEPDRVHAFADAMAAELADDSDRVAAVFHRVDLAHFEARASLYLEPSVLETFERLGGSEALAQLRVHPDPGVRLHALGALLEEVPDAVTNVASSGDTELLAVGLKRVLVQMEGYALEGQRGPLTLMDRETALASALARRPGRGGLDTEGYLTTDDGHTGIIFVRPTYTRDEMDVVVPFVRTVRAAGEAAAARVDGVRFGLTGIPASSVDELEALEHDTVLTSVIALIGVVLLFVTYFPALRLLGLSLVPVGFGVVWTAAVIRILFGHLNLMSSVFLVVLIGMGIDFSVHIAARFLEQRRLGEDAATAARVAVERAGRGVVTGAVTSAGAFMAVGWSGFKGIEELGIAASLGLLITVGFALTVFPAALTWSGPRIPFQRSRALGMGPFVRRVLKIRPVVLALALGVTPPALWMALETPFDFSLLNLLPEDAESAQLMAEMIEKRDLSANAVAVPVESLDAARTLEDELRDLPGVHNVVSAASFIPENQPARLQVLKRVREALAAAKARAAEQTPAPVALTDALSELELAMERIAELAFTGGEKKAVDHLEQGLTAVADVRDAAARDGDALEAGLRAYTEDLSQVVEKLVSRVDETLEAGPITPAVLPDNLRSRFVSGEGRFAVYAVPKASVWDRPALGRFLEEVRAVAPEVTGFPATFYENTALIQRGFVRAALYASVAVVFLLLLDLRRIRYVVYALVPVGLGAVWMLGAMYLAGLPYNLANIVGLPLIIGVGIDNGVHLLHRYLETESVEVATVQTGGAVVLSSLTTMVGFGSLAFASHRGYSTLGQILFIGVGACLVAAITVLPSVLVTVESRRSGACG